MKLILSFILSTVVLTSCGMSNMNSSDIAPVSKSDSGIHMPTVSAKIGASAEYKGCIEQSINMCVQSIGMQLAQKTKDPEYCNELPNIDQKNGCIFALTMNTAIEKKDITLCKNISDVSLSGQCAVRIHTQSAIEKKDITLCDMIAVVSPGKEGTGSIAIDPSMSRDQCKLEVIMQNTNAVVGDCETIMGTGSQDMCSIMIKNRPPSINIAPSNMQSSGTTSR